MSVKVSDYISYMEHKAISVRNLQIVDGSLRVELVRGQESVSWVIGNNVLIAIIAAHLPFEDKAKFEEALVDLVDISTSKKELTTEEPQLSIRGLLKHIRENKHLYEK